MTKHRVRTQAPTSTWRFWKLLKSANHQRIQQEVTNRNTQDKEELTSSGATVKYKYSHVWTKNQSFSRLTLPTTKGCGLAVAGA